MGRLAHLGVGFGLLQVQFAGFFQCVQPGVFFNRQDPSGGFIHHDVMRTTVIAHNRGRACRHGFDDHVSEGVGDARKQEEIGIGVKAGECFAALFACKMHAVVAFKELLDFFEVPAVTHVHELHVVMLDGELLPDIVQEFQVFFFGNAADERETHLAVAFALDGFGRTVVFFPDAFSAQVHREFFQGEPAGQDLYLIGGDLQLRSQNVGIVLARANNGLCHSVENLHEPKHEVEHPLGLYERTCVSRNVGAVMAKDFDAGDFGAEAYEPGSRAGRLEFNQVNGVALEQAKYRAYAGNGEFAVCIPELLHAEQAREQNAVAVFDDTAGARIEGVACQKGVHAVGAHVGNHVS